MMELQKLSARYVLYASYLMFNLQIFQNLLFTTDF